MRKIFPVLRWFELPDPCHLSQATLTTHVEPHPLPVLKNQIDIVMSDSNIEQEALPPVSSLRNRFEALAAQQNGGAGTNSTTNLNNGPSKITSPFLAGGVGSKSTGNAGAGRWRGNSPHSAVPSTSPLVGDRPLTPTVVVHEASEPSQRVVSTPIHIPKNSVSRSSSSSSLRTSVHFQELNSGIAHCSPPLKRTSSLSFGSSSCIRATIQAKSSFPGDFGQPELSIRTALERPAPLPPLGDAGNVEDQLKPHKMCVFQPICLKCH
jgi:hypothetical protein